MVATLDITSSVWFSMKKQSASLQPTSARRSLRPVNSDASRRCRPAGPAADVCAHRRSPPSELLSWNSKRDSARPASAEGTEPADRIAGHHRGCTSQSRASAYAYRGSTCIGVCVYIDRSSARGPAEFPAAPCHQGKKERTLHRPLATVFISVGSVTSHAYKSQGSQSPYPERVHRR